MYYTSVKQSAIYLTSQRAQNYITQKTYAYKYLQVYLNETIFSRKNFAEEFLLFFTVYSPSQVVWSLLLKSFLKEVSIIIETGPLFC